MAFIGTWQFRRDTAASWASSNPVLLAGELGIESDTDKFKLGNGTTPWNGRPYGGIQGPQGATGATGASGSNGWSPILANVADGERRVLRLVDWTGGTGTKPAVPTNNYIGPTGFTDLAGATDIRGATGATGAQGPAGATQNTFGTIAVAGQNNVVADAANDTLTLVAGTNITLLTNDATDSITINSTSVATNAFGVVTGNTGTATADTPTDTLAIAGGTGISTAATDTPDGLVITNTDTGSAARAAHEAAADPHPQYLTQAEGDARYQAAGQSAGPTFTSAVLTATQANSTTVAATLTGHTFTVPPGKTAMIEGILIFTAAATATGAFYGFSLTQGAGANGNAQGSWRAEVALTSAAAATGLADGDTINAAGGATVASGVLGTASVAGNNSAWIRLIVRNSSTNVNTTVNLQFRSEFNASAVTAQIGTGATATIG